MAKFFAYKDLPADRTPILYLIKISGEEGFFDMKPEFTAYASDKEVLIQDGLDYEIKGIKLLDSTEENGKRLLQVELVHPPRCLNI